MPRLPSAILRAFTILLFAGAAHAEAAPQLPTRSLLSLTEAIARAERASPRLDAVRAVVDAATGAEVQSLLYPNPNFFIDAANVAGSGPYRDGANAELTAGFGEHIELGGKRAARQTGAAAERRAAETELAAARLDLVRDVTIAFSAVVAAQEDLRLARDLEAAARKVLAEVARRVAAGKDPLFQKSRAEAALATATVASRHALQVSAGARQALGRYWGEAALVEAVDGASLIATAAPAPLLLYEDRIARTPDVARFDRLREAREADLALARARNIPDLDATIGVRRFAGSRDTALIAGFSFPVPVLNQNQGEIARAGAEVARMRAERQRATRERRQELVAMWTEWQSTWSDIVGLKIDVVPRAERAFNLALDGFRRGGFRYLDVLDAQRAFSTREAHSPPGSRACRSRAPASNAWSDMPSIRAGGCHERPVPAPRRFRRCRPVRRGSGLRFPG
jgi:cobalt-zinc-cadmium efflux system outer membrane protein